MIEQEKSQELVKTQNLRAGEVTIPTMEEMAKEVNLAIKTLKDGTLPS